MILEGVVGVPRDDGRQCEFAVFTRARDVETGKIVEEFELAPEGRESVCMGFHFWTDGDFQI